MDRETLNDYLTVKESMGPLAAFDARRIIAKWMSLKQRRPKTDDSVDRSTAVMMEEDNKLYFLHSTTTPYLEAYYTGNRHTHTCSSKYVSISISDETTTQQGYRC